jgi:hypothetical protein
LTYLIGRERQEADEKEIREFKSRMIAVDPGRADEINALFNEDKEFAPRLSDEELESAPGYSANEIESALDIMKELGFAVQDMD